MIAMIPTRKSWLNRHLELHLDLYLHDGALYRANNDEALVSSKEILDELKLVPRPVDFDGAVDVSVFFEARGWSEDAIGMSPPEGDETIVVTYAHANGVVLSNSLVAELFREDLAECAEEFRRVT